MMTFTTKDQTIKGFRCRFIERMAHGGWQRCDKLASNVNYMHQTRGSHDLVPYHFCKEHANYSYIAMVWEEFLNQKWTEDPYAHFYIEDWRAAHPEEARARKKAQGQARQAGG